MCVSFSQFSAVVREGAAVREGAVVREGGRMIPGGPSVELHWRLKVIMGIIIPEVKLGNKLFFSILTSVLFALTTIITIVCLFCLFSFLLPMYGCVFYSFILTSSCRANLARCSERARWFERAVG